jgi:hypothetical protein
MPRRDGACSSTTTYGTSSSTTTYGTTIYGTSSSTTTYGTTTYGTSNSTTNGTTTYSFGTLVLGSFHALVQSCGSDVIESLCDGDEGCG